MFLFSLPPHQNRSQSKPFPVELLLEMWNLFVTRSLFYYFLCCTFERQFNKIPHQKPSRCLGQNKRKKNIKKNPHLQMDWQFHNTSNYTSFHMLLSTWICILNNIKFIWLFGAHRSCSCSCMNRVVSVFLLKYTKKSVRVVFIFHFIMPRYSERHCLRRNF